MLVILAIAAIAILACVVLVSLGRGGELTEFPPDVPPLDLPEPGQLTAVDFMALQLPVNLVGYHTQSVDETLRRAASAISARDTRIAVLEQRVSELLSSRLHARQEVYAAPGAGLRTDHEPEAPADPRELPESGDPVSVSGATVDWDSAAELRHRPEDAEWRVPPGNGTPVAAAPEDPKPEDPKPEDPEPEDLEPEDSKPEEAAEPKAAESDGAQSDDAQSDSARSDDAHGDDARSEDDEPAELRSEDVKSEEDEPVRVALAKDAAPVKDGDERP
ncbi:hypothetical protein [Nonomuraea zeae]|uniref:DivIVA domain-containing protein n=1 Tax=Nonomuraea zeae TaxID=1642303 RepID=A0A5S4GEJ5_9ACTN|nr:hypothetical protein [Nonomuraea zeae]TMR31406.1 hypothetical protein ETD85_25990 [Nonomuraea zeae]